MIVNLLKGDGLLGIRWKWMLPVQPMHKLVKHKLYLVDLVKSGNWKSGQFIVKCISKFSFRWKTETNFLMGATLGE